jgi:hypothetical protein
MAKSKTRRKPAKRKVAKKKTHKKATKKKAVKKKRGRPALKKRPRGRPPKNTQKKRGRPKGSKNKKKKPSTESEYKPPKAYRFLGLCPKCKGMIGTLDLVSKFIFVCPYCEKRARLNKLKADKPVEEKVSKKEYLNSSIKTDYHDMPALNEKPEVVNPVEV